VTSLEQTVVGPDEKRHALNDVLNSQTFARSDQLKRFLRFICEKEIAGKADEISEYSIGIEALGKSKSYWSGDDSSVRTRAYVLRQKLQEFYELERPNAEIRIEVPRGSYIPRFVSQAGTADQLPPEPITVGAVETVLLGSEPGRWPQRAPIWIFLAGLFVGALIFGCILLTVHRRGDAIASPIDPIIRRAWGPMLNAGEHVYVCLATPPALLLHSYREDRLPQSPKLLRVPEEVSDWYKQLRMMDGGGKLYMHTTQNVALFGDSLAADSAVRLLSAAGAVAQVVPENNLRPFALRGRNVIVIGSPNYSPFAGRILRDAPFSVRYEPDTREEVISSNPSTARPKLVFRPRRNEYNQLLTAYGLITVIPSPGSGDGEARTIIFAGITSAGPQAAMEFFKSSAGLNEVLRHLKSRADGKFPPMYQVVVKCDLDNNLALNWAYMTHVVMDTKPGT
jgi:hypothetical protein